MTSNAIHDADALKDGLVTLMEHQRDKGFRTGLWTGVIIAFLASVAVEVLCRWL